MTKNILILNIFLNNPSINLNYLAGSVQVSLYNQLKNVRVIIFPKEYIKPSKGL